MARVHFRDVGTHDVEVDRAFAVAFARANVLRLDQREHVAFEHGVASHDGELGERAGDVRADLVLHLHRFHDEHDLTGAHGLPGFDLDADDRALHRRGEGCTPVVDVAFGDRGARGG